MLFPPLQTVYIPLVFFLLCRLSSLCNTDNTSQPLFHGYGYLVISSTSLEVGGISSLICFVVVLRFFVCVTCYARQRDQFKTLKTLSLFLIAQERSNDINQNPSRQYLVNKYPHNLRKVFLWSHGIFVPSPAKGIYAVSTLHSLSLSYPKKVATTQHNLSDFKKTVFILFFPCGEWRCYSRIHSPTTVIQSEKEREVRNRDVT